MNKLQKYAELLARSGVNVQKGQEVIVQAELDQPEFVYMVTEELYKAGASKVIVEWFHQPLSKLHYKYRSDKTLAKIEKWELDKLEWRCKELPCLLYLTSEDPDGLNGVDQNKISKASQKRYPKIKPFIDRMDNKYQWCIAAVPGKAWAKKIYPDLPYSKSEKLLWNNILSCARVDSNPIKAWKNHYNDLKKKADYLNSLGLKELIYKSSNGTDFKVGLIEDSVFQLGGDYTTSKVFFNANIPSEEIFISPKRGVAEGIVYSTKPLSYRGELIKDFSIRFENGKAVEVKAKENQKLLEEMISQDKGAAYLGECALVPFDSPINNTGILFYNTLFDENACCHLALGRGFTSCIKDYEKYSQKELEEKGINESMNHEDFMIGSKDLMIKGITKANEEVVIFINGNWAF